MGDLTTYELAKLRLQAFAALNGRSIKNQDGVLIPLSDEQRKEIADELVEWAIGTGTDE